MQTTVPIAAGRQAKVIGLLSVVMLALPPGRVDAQPPRVEFDVEYSVECLDVTPESFAGVYPDEKIVEMTLAATVWIVEGGEEDLHELTLAVTSPDRRMRVFDFLPQTQLESEVSGEISVVRSTESIRSLGASLNGHFAAPHGIVAAQASPSGNATATSRDELKESSQKIPAKTAVLISGTIDGGHGVLFKFKRSVQDSLEGTKQFTCRFIVPREWRGDWIRVACRARGHDRQLVFDKLVDVGRADFSVGLYLAGDRPAKQAALSLARAQGAFRALQREDESADQVDRLVRLVSDTRDRVGTSSAKLIPKPIKERARDWGWIDELSKKESDRELSPGQRLREARNALRWFAASDDSDHQSASR